jgi:hypothetical protein
MTAWSTPTNGAQMTANKTSMIASVMRWILKRQPPKGHRVFLMTSLFAKCMEQNRRPLAEVADLNASLGLVTDVRSLEVPISFRNILWSDEEHLVNRVSEAARSHENSKRRAVAYEIMNTIPSWMVYGQEGDFHRDFNVLCDVIERNLAR